jgi:hypothetical protein
MKRASLALILLLAVGVAAAGCAAMGKLFRGLKEANEPYYYWTRQKVFTYAVNDSAVKMEEDSALKSLPQDYTGESVVTLPGVALAKPTESFLPVEVGRAIPKESAKKLDSLKEMCPFVEGPDFVDQTGQVMWLVDKMNKFTVLKSKNGEWNRELFYLLNEKAVITLEVNGPKTIMILSMVRIDRAEPLDNKRKYIYSVEDENKVVTEVPAYATRRNDVLFYDVEAESASTPHVYAIRVPEGKHTLTFKYKYTDGGNILLKFFEAVYK